MARRQYPAYIIDRSRRSAASRFSDDFVVCPDKECGFIARVYKVARSRRDETLAALAASSATYVYKTFGDATVVLEIVHFLYAPTAHKSRVSALVNKALKAYIYGEEGAVSSRKGWDAQLGALDDVIRMSEAQRSHLNDMNGAEATEAFVEALRSARASVQLLKTMIDHAKE